MKITVQVLLILLLAISCQNKPTKTDFVEGGAEQGFLPPPVWNSSMQNLKQEMLSIQHFIFDKEQFENPQNKAFLRKKIHQLAEESKNVKHDPVTWTKDPTLRFVAAQFAEELQKADENFQAGWTEYSRWQLVKTTNYCLECHTRMRDGPSFNPENSTRDYFTRMPVPSRIEFLISFRQFEPALKLSMEKLSVDQEDKQVDVDSDRIARLGLLVALQYMQDREKTQKLINVIKQNKDLPDYLKKSNRLWQHSLDRWDENDRLDQLPKIRAFVNRRTSEVDDLIAIPALLRLLTTPLSRDELGETLYLTGKSYAAFHRGAVVPLHENYYEACVRQAPQTKWGALCYKKLSESVADSYTGSAGTRIPVDVKIRLEHLKKEIEEKK